MWQIMVFICNFTVPYFSILHFSFVTIWINAKYICMQKTQKNRTLIANTS